MNTHVSIRGIEMHVSYRIHSSWTFVTNSKMKLVLDIQNNLIVMLNIFF